MIDLSNSRLNLLRRQTARLTHVWRISRQDGGNPLQFTTHDQILNRWDSTIYDPRPGITMSANRRARGLGEKSTEISGLIGEGGVTYQDLHQGRLWGSEVRQYLHDWAFDFTGEMTYNQWYIHDITYDDRTWTIQLSGISSRIRGKRGEVFSRLCQNELGVMNFLQDSVPTTSACPVVITTHPKKITAAPIVGTETTHGVNPTLRTIYVKQAGTSGLANAAHTTGDFAANYFGHGRVVFRSGVLDGLQETIYAEIDLGTSAHNAGVRALRFMRPLPDLPAIGDTLDMFVGCDKNWQTCRDKFDALQGNVSVHPSTSGGFRGFPEIPGTDRAATYPPAR